MRFSLGLTRNHTDAQDLYQETLLRALRFFHRFQPGTNFTAWVTTVMRNIYISLHRRKKHSPLSVEAETLEFMSRGSMSTARKENSSLNGKIFLSDSVRLGLAEIPEKLRGVIFLADLMEMKYREVAQVLQIPIGTVMSRLFRARRVLRERLKRFSPDDSPLNS